MKITCDIILDLIPLVKDEVASDDSILIVKDHINECETCRVEFDLFQPTIIDQQPIKDEKIILAIKRSIFITQLTILMVGAIIGVALTNSMGMFYNLIIMPIIGGIAFFALKKKWYIAPIVIFMLTYLWQMVTGIAMGGFDWTALYSGLNYSVIYTVLVGLGIIIAMLLKFAFKKEGD